MLKSRNIRRSDAVVDSTPKEGNLVRVLKPKMLSLVGHPANSVGFKVLRSDTTEEGKTQTTKENAVSTKAPATKATVVRRTRRSDTASPVLALTFPDGTTRESVDAALESYGMSGYRVEESEGVFRAIRSDLQTIATDGTLDIKLNEAGVLATVTRSEGLTPVAVDAEKPNITLNVLRFDDTFTAESAAEWCKGQGIEGTPVEVEGAVSLIRADVGENEETRELEIDTGVTAILTRSVYGNVPDQIVAVVDEYAYGSWGWGQLDFTAAMADVEFSDKVRQGISKLEDVLRQILFYSPLPIETRKLLMTQALDQFGAFSAAIMDNLPRALLVSVVRSDNIDGKGNEMNAKATQAAAATTAASASQDTSNTEAPLTRSDVVGIVAEAVAKAMADAGGDKPAVAATAEAGTAAATDTAVGLTRSDLVAALTEANKPLLERIEKMEGQTVVRSDTGDAATTQVTQTAEEKAAATAAAVKSGEIFRGALGNIGGRRAG